MSTEQKKNVVFSEEIDSSIDGLALGAALILSALFVIWFKVFNNPIVERVIAIILLLFGMVGTVLEIDKIKKNGIKGGDDVALGLLFAIPSVLGIIKTDIIWIHAVAFLGFLFGTYGLVRGVLKIVYSLRLVKRKSKSKKIEIMQIVMTITEVIALLVAVLQLISEINY